MSSITDVSGELGYYDLLGLSEKARWEFHELPWDGLDRSKVTEDAIHNTKTAAYGELTTFSATESFMNLFRSDIDFTQWLAVWFYEETKHPLALIRYLKLLDIPTDENFIHDGRAISPMVNDRVVMLVSNICSEIAANTSYTYVNKSVEEPLLSDITRNLARDEMRHSNGFQFYLRKTLARAEDLDGERLKALRMTWFLVDSSSNGVTQHPVYLTVRRLRGLDTAAIEARIQEKILDRMGKVLDLDIPTRVDDFYDFYARFKKSYRSSRKANQDLVEAV
jgi:tRNA isopentenyl-2-thiomethyl-A-37 hydroxylase MiaE